jgi:hypothetical protein
MVPPSLRLGLVAVVLVLWGCGAEVTSPLPVASPSKGLDVSCGDFPPAGCEAATSAVMKSVSQLAPVIRVELGRGILCPIPDLVQETTTCPRAGLDAPGGGTWVGHAIVTFWNQDRRAFLNVSQQGGASFSVALITLAVPKESG